VMRQQRTNLGVLPSPNNQIQATQFLIAAIVIGTDHPSTQGVFQSIITRNATRERGGVLALMSV
jgi:hypothetical protein